MVGDVLQLQEALGPHVLHTQTRVVEVRPVVRRAVLHRCQVQDTTICQQGLASYYKEILLLLLAGIAAIRPRFVVVFK